MGASGGTVVEPKQNGAISDELVTAAEQAGLQYDSDERPGYSRRAKGKHFQYFDTEGKLIRDEQRLDLPVAKRSCSGDWSRRAWAQAISVSRALARSARRKQVRATRPVCQGPA